MCLLFDQPGADAVEKILEGDAPVALPFIALMETRYVLMRAFPPDRVDQLIAMLRGTQAEILESSPHWGEVAARVKSGGGLSLADAWMAALALMRDARLAHRDPEFHGVAGLQSLWIGEPAAVTR
jgi:predicted nucleic acid-binding protein